VPDRHVYAEQGCLVAYHVSRGDEGKLGEDVSVDVERSP
jgi:hypothetical protein